MTRSMGRSSAIEWMGLGSNRYVQLFDLLGRTDTPKDGLAAYGKTASITSSRSMNLGSAA